MRVYVLMMFDCLDCGQFANVYDTREGAEKAREILEECADVKYACVYEREVITSNVDESGGSDGKEGEKEADS